MKKEFVLGLCTLAELTGRTLSKEVIALYDQELGPLGYDRLVPAIRKLCVDRGDRDPFPSIRTIRELLSPKANPEAEATEAVARIIESISRYGYTGAVEAKEYIGELGWQVVMREGGWIPLCERALTTQLPSFRAQWINLAKSIQERAKLGTLGVAPALPPSERPRAATDKIERCQFTKLLPGME